MCFENMACASYLSCQTIAKSYAEGSYEIATLLGYITHVAINNDRYYISNPSFSINGTRMGSYLLPTNVI